MIAEALKFIFSKADESANPKPNIRNLSTRERVVTLNGEVTNETIAAPLIVRNAHTLDSVVMLVEEFGNVKPTAYVDDDGVSVVLDDSDRQEPVTMAFELSDQFRTLDSLKGGKSQREMVRILRTSLAGCVEHDLFLQIVRQLEFDVRRNANGNVQHSSESLGNSVEKQVKAKAGDLPEEVQIRVPLFSVPHDVPTEIILTCAVTLDIDNEKLAIEPTGDSLSREKKRVLTEIIGRLDSMMPDETVVVFGGCSVAPLVS